MTLLPLLPLRHLTARLKRPVNPDAAATEQQRSHGIPLHLLPSALGLGLMLGAAAFQYGPVICGR